MYKIASTITQIDVNLINFKYNNFSKWNTKKTNLLLNNINDNEEYENETEYIKINSKISYLEKVEMAFINGIILVKIIE